MTSLFTTFPSPVTTAAHMLPCHDADAADLFFSERPADLERAKALCADCPLIQECREGALERAEPWGVWGGAIFESGRIIAVKRGRGRPRKNREPDRSEDAA
ncbi:WhiB family transcriptional regulator [Brachybacterium sp. GCM10030267]|uniref:WhiB family transcriptional regulator n=1 Tax=unclassified Brachybacterium TaxID=2623841 RepID=UPI0036190A5D